MRKTRIGDLNSQSPPPLLKEKAENPSTENYYI